MIVNTLSLVITIHMLYDISIQNRTGTVYLEGRHTNLYTMLTLLLIVSVLKDSNPYRTAPKAEAFPYLNRPIGIEPIFSVSKTVVLTIILKAINGYLKLLGSRNMISIIYLIFAIVFCEHDIVLGGIRIDLYEMR